MKKETAKKSIKRPERVAPKRRKPIDIMRDDVNELRHDMDMHFDLGGKQLKAQDRNIDRIDTEVTATNGVLARLLDCYNELALELSAMKVWANKMGYEAGDLTVEVSGQGVTYVAEDFTPPEFTNDASIAGTARLLDSTSFPHKPCPHRQMHTAHPWGDRPSADEPEAMYWCQGSKG